MVRQEPIEVPTTGHGDVHDLTPSVTAIVRRSGIGCGVAHVFVQGSTGAVVMMECERGLKADLPRMLDSLAPPSADYAHEQTWHDGNGHSHLQATLLGQAVSFPIAEGAPLLGTWQQIVLIECDIKPRRRTVVVTVAGE
jgi:secondary thiamine-phosphate synthase enzyme